MIMFSMLRVPEKMSIFESPPPKLLFCLLTS
nr:MAG TPA: hypothetical protein [Caudoviricetes sp.]